MNWQHYNKLASAMAYIEKLVLEIESSLDGRKRIYEEIDLDLTPEQVDAVRKEVEEILEYLDEVKKSFNLEVSPLKASRVIETNASFIWETIENTYSSKIEKSSGKIDSAEEKKRMDEFLDKILSRANKIRRIIRS